MRDAFVAAVRSQVGRPYIWGGQDPKIGFDCSGLVIWAMNQAGLPIRDHSSSQLAAIYEGNQVGIKTAYPGCLVFYGNTEDSIKHVMTVVDVWPDGTFAMVGARGGDAYCTKAETAAKLGACVDCVLGPAYWSRKFRFCADPFLEEIHSGQE